MRNFPPEIEKYISQRLAGLSPIFAQASVGDFSKDVQLPPEDDDFAEVYAGVQIMIDVIREKLAEVERVNEQLAKQVKDLERLNRFMVGRELKMRELKQHLRELERALSSLPPRA